jgi:hypothetical protein
MLLPLELPPPDNVFKAPYHLTCLSSEESEFAAFDIPAATTPILQSPSDLLRFGILWPALRELHVHGQLIPLIQERRAQIEGQKEHWRYKIEQKKAELPDFYGTIQSTLDLGKIVSIQTGYGGAYFVYDHDDQPVFVLKAVDEDIFTLNNKKLRSSPFIDQKYRVRPNIPLYRSAQTEALAYECAVLMNIEHVTPKAAILIVENPGFYDLSEQLDPEEQKIFTDLTGAARKEKLCSVQEFVTDSVEMAQVVQEWMKIHEEFQEIGMLFDADDYEDLCIFLWTIYETDGHGGNCLAYVKRRDGENQPIYGLKKIDNGLCFPEANAFFRNYLIELPNSHYPLSERAKQLILGIPVETISKKMIDYEMGDCLPAFHERMDVLKELALRPHLTLYDIDLRLKLLDFPKGKQLALSNLSRKILERLIEQEDGSFYE